MKRCPRCNADYTDDLMFCLSDGTPLVRGSERFEEPTVVRRFDGPGTTASSRSAGSYLKYVAIAAVMLVVAIPLLGVVGWFLWTRMDDPVSPVTNRSETPEPPKTAPTQRNSDADIKAKEEELERERQRLADERKKLEAEKQQSTERPPEPERFVDPGTRRITFSRGSVGKTVSGRIARSRTFVLRTLAGQYLSANVRSPNGCVVFSSGTASTGFTTGAGDTFLYLTNNCGTVSNFTLNVNVR